MGRRMDVVLAGVPKSGTSMLCNAMTVARQAVVLYEPTRSRFRMERLRRKPAASATTAATFWAGPEGMRSGG